MTDLLDRLQAIAELTLKLGEVERSTHHPDGRPETVTTHTTMLALVAATVADCTHLDGSLMMAFALVHDLTEAHTGDVDTIRPLDDEGTRGKIASELDALKQIEGDGAPGWIVEMIRLYEAQALPEARAVRVLDKMMPRLTNRANGCRSVIARGIDAEELGRLMAEQDTALSRQYPELRELIGLLQGAALQSLMAWGD